MPLRGRHPIVGVVAMAEPVRFEAEITLGRAEVLDVVACCEEAGERAEVADEAELAFRLDGVRRLLLGRLMGEPAAPDG